MMAKDVAQAAGGHQVFDIAAVAWPFGNDDVRRPFAPAEFDGCRNHVRMGIDHFVAVIFDNIGLDDDPLPGQGDTLPKSLILALEGAGQVGVVVSDWRDVNSAGT